MSTLTSVDSVFVNPKGKLCKTVILFGKPLMTMIDITPKFDGYDVRGKVINENDFSFVHNR